jgi:hypothetical protein
MSGSAAVLGALGVSCLCTTSGPVGPLALGVGGVDPRTSSALASAAHSPSRSEISRGSGRLIRVGLVLSDCDGLPRIVHPWVNGCARRASVSALDDVLTRKSLSAVRGFFPSGLGPAGPIDRPGGAGSPNGCCPTLSRDTARPPHADDANCAITWVLRNQPRFECNGCTATRTKVEAGAVGYDGG